MNDSHRAREATVRPIDDVQGRPDMRRIPINKVGIKDIYHPVRVLDRSGGEQHGKRIVGPPRAKLNFHVAETGAIQQASEVLVAESKPAIAELLADPALVVRPKIEDQQAAAGLEDARRFVKRL